MCTHAENRYRIFRLCSQSLAGERTATKTALQEYPFILAICLLKLLFSCRTLTFTGGSMGEPDFVCSENARASRSQDFSAGIANEQGSSRGRHDKPNCAKHVAPSCLFGMHNRCSLASATRNSRKSQLTKGRSTIHSWHAPGAHCSGHSLQGPRPT